MIYNACDIPPSIVQGDALSGLRKNLFSCISYSAIKKMSLCFLSFIGPKENIISTLLYFESHKSPTLTELQKIDL